MRGFKSIFSIVLAVLFLSSIQSSADTFVVTNLNDPGAGSLRQAITNSNLNPGPDTIEFNEGLQGTIFLNVGNLAIQDDLTLTGPGADKITIDAEGKSHVFDVIDDDNEKNNIVIISGLRLINGIASTGSLIDNNENLTLESCQFLNGNASISGGAIYNTRFLTVDSSMFENNSAEMGGAIFNSVGGIILSINNSEFRFNEANVGGAILNENANIELITNSTFSDNTAFNGGAIYNRGGSIIQISNSTFNQNNTKGLFGGDGGAISNTQTGNIFNIVNSTLSENVARIGSAIRNDGFVNISFTTIADNFTPPPPTPQPFPTPTPNPSIPTPPPPPIAGIATLNNGQTNIRNSIVAFNFPNNCDELFGSLNDFGGNYSDDFSCGFTGDGSVILLNPITDIGGPTETMNLIGGDPVNGATVNCDALDENGNPTGIPIGVDQRYFPRPFGVRCDSGAVESMPASIVTITKASQPRGIEGFEFVSNGFGSLVGCGITGDSGKFTLDDGGSESCIVPVGDYTIREKVPNGYRLFIVCFGENPNLIIDNEKGEIIFSVPEIEPSPDVDCIFNNIKKGNGGGGGGCTLAGSSNNYSFPLYLFIPALILFRRVVRKYRFKLLKANEYKTNKLNVSG